MGAAAWPVRLRRCRLRAENARRLFRGCAFDRRLGGTSEVRAPLAVRTILPPLPTRPAPLTLARARARGADGRSAWTVRRHSTSPRAHPTHVASPCASATSLANGLAPAYTTPTGLSRSATLTSASGASTAVSPLSVPRRLWRGSLTRVFLVRLCGSSSAPASGSSGIAARTRGADAGGSAAVARRAALELELAVAGVAIVLGATLLV